MWGASGTHADTKSRRGTAEGPALCLRGPLAREPSCALLFCDATVLQTFGTRGWKEILIIIHECSNKSLLRQHRLQVMVIAPSPEVYFVATTRRQGVSITVSVEVVAVPTASLLRQLQLFLQWLYNRSSTPKAGGCVCPCLPSANTLVGSRCVSIWKQRNQILIHSLVANMSCCQVLGMNSSCVNQQVKDFFLTLTLGTK